MVGLDVLLECVGGVQRGVERLSVGERLEDRLSLIERLLKGLLLQRMKRAAGQPNALQVRGKGEEEGRTSASSAALSAARAARSCALPAYFLTMCRIVSMDFLYSC